MSGGRARRGRGRGRAAGIAAALAFSLPVVGATLPAVGGAGGTVTARPVPGTSEAIRAVACGSAADCLAVGSTPTAFGPEAVVDATTDAGVTWVAAPVKGEGGLVAVACADRRHCMAVGGGATAVVLTTADGGRRWKAVAAPAGAATVSAVDCASAADCLVLATGGAGYWSASTTDGGRVWQRTGTLPVGFGGPTSVNCAGATCMSAGYQSLTGAKGTGAVARTADGGRTWSAAAVPAGTGPLHDVACESGRCLAVGTSSPNLADVTPAPSVVLHSADGGQTWAGAAAPAGVGDAVGVACATALGCATVGTGWTSTDPPAPVGAVATTADGGRTWRPVAGGRLASGLADVACPAASACVAGGGDLLARVTLPSAGRGR